MMVKALSFEAMCYIIVDNRYHGITGPNTCLYGNLLFACVLSHMQWCMCGGQEDSFWECVHFPSTMWIQSMNGTQAVSVVIRLLPGSAGSTSPLCSTLGSICIVGFT